MTSSTSPRSRSRLIGVAVLASAVVGSALTPLVAGTAAAAAPLPAAAVVGPTDSGPLLKDVVLDWSAVAGAKAYRVQVGTDDEWSDAPTLAVDTVATRFTLPTWLPHASYVWRVAALGDATQSRWATGGTFTRGWLAKPDGLVTSAGGSWVPEFRWNPVPTASEYQLQLSTSPYFNDASPTTTQASPVTQACFTTRTSVTPATSQKSVRSPGPGDCNFSLLGDGETLFWRVRALDHVVDGSKEVDTTPVVDEGISHLPPTKMNELDTTACPAPPKTEAGSTSAPVVGGVPQPSPTPSTTASPTADPSAPATSATSPSASAAPVLSCEPDNDVEKSAWSTPATVASTYPGTVPDDTRRFSRLPVVPVAVGPDRLCDAAAVCRDFPTLRWDAVPGADAYRVYVALDAAFTNIQHISETFGTSWTPRVQWRDSTASRSYYYAVQPCTFAGCGPVPSAPASIRKSSPKLATVDAGARGPIGGEVLLSWQAHSDALRAAGAPVTSEAYAYRVQVTTDADPDFVGALVDEAEVDATHHVSPTKTYPEGTLLWRVQAVDASGHRLPWSAVRSFRHDASAPTFTVTPNGNLAVGGSVTVTFSEPVRGVSGSSVTLAGAAATVTTAPDGRRVTVTPRSRLTPGATHAVSVSGDVTDLAGNAVVSRAAVVGVDPLVDDRSPAMGLGGAWQRLLASNAVAGTYSRSVPTPTRKTAATVALHGRGAEVKGCVGPANGVLELWADGVRLTRIDTYRSYSGCGVRLTRAPFATVDGFHRIQVRGVGVKNVRSKGTAISIDAITAVK